MLKIRRSTLKELFLSGVIRKEMAKQFFYREIFSDRLWLIDHFIAEIQKTHFYRCIGLKLESHTRRVIKRLTLFWNDIYGLPYMIFITSKRGFMATVCETVAFGVDSHNTKTVGTRFEWSLLFTSRSPPPRVRYIGRQLLLNYFYNM